MYKRYSTDLSRDFNPHKLVYVYMYEHYWSIHLKINFRNIYLSHQVSRVSQPITTPNQNWRDVLFFKCISILKREYDSCDQILTPLWACVSHRIFLFLFLLLIHTWDVRIRPFLPPQRCKKCSLSAQCLYPHLTSVI